MGLSARLDGPCEDGSRAGPVRQCDSLSPSGQTCLFEAEGENTVRISLPEVLDPIATVIRVRLEP